MLTAFFTGFGASLGLIAAIGAQNAFMLRLGLKGEHILPLVLICAVSDAVLISAGVAGFGDVLARFPWLEPALLYGGIAFLTYYGFTSLKSAWLNSEALNAADIPSISLKEAVLTLLAFTWLNPHVYLDTVVFLGTISTRFAENRWIFAMGATLGSLAFFFALGYGARLLRPVLSSARAWRALDTGIGLLMWGIAARLAFSA